MILHTSITGDGEPIVLIHSGGMTGVTEYKEQTEYFSAQNYKVIRPDLRGHGKSVGSLENFFSDCVKDLYETLDHLQIKQCHVAGVSVGGIVSLMFAKEYPGMVKSLCFSGVFPIEPENWAESSKEEAEHYEQLFHNDEAVAYLNEIHGDNDWKSLLRFMAEDDFYPFEHTGNVSALQMPTLYTVGEQQEQEVSAAITYKQLNPNIHISVIPFAGHLVHREQPNLYSQILHTFIK
ncbi:alpha/beta fold hydrolase [Bacillus mesophilum]|uniref:Alpha/beta fold hydrolase n=1 Tax=Bacillus mesophilum TaxID=1071718 RepID=A0A7V7RKP3_9BACI|nr:alpha/beta fold hydrolase [Bacillus mesophilum]KAB2331909.1 alpha/beta fold hydrolase [Bacillus mesophilum]